MATKEETMDLFEKRVMEIFNLDEVPAVEYDSLGTYCEYLTKNLKLPIEIKPSEEMERPSFSMKESYKLIQIDNEIDEDYGLFVTILQTTGKKESFDLPMVDIIVKDKKSKSYEIIDDYITWFWNYR